MRIKTNLPKAIVYREASSDSTKPAVYFRPTALASSDDFIKIIYGGECFAAIGKNGSVAYSTEGQTWTARKLGEYFFSDIDYINGTYFIVGSAGTKGLILSSVDLVSWKTEAELEPIKPPTSTADSHSLQLRGIWHNGSGYVLVATVGYAAYYAQYIYSGSDIKALKAVLAGEKINCNDTYSPVLKGNSRIGLVRKAYSNSKAHVLHTSDGVNFESVVLPWATYSPNAEYPIFFYEGYFLQGAHYMPPMTSSSYEKYAHMYRSINLKEWEIMGPGIEHDSDRVDLPYFIGAVRIGGHSLYIGEHIGMLLADGEDMLVKTQADCFNISQSVTINSVARSDKRIACAGNGGIIFSANVDISDKDLIIEPSAVNQEIYISRSDNVRMLHVKAATGGIDPNIRPGNIKRGVTILGVTGTYGG